MNTSSPNDSLPSNITDLLTRAARSHPESGLTYCLGGADAPQEFQSYPELLRDARCLLAALRAHGLAPQGRVVLILEQQRQFLTAFWACVLGGFVPCPLTAQDGDPDLWASQLAHVNSVLEQPLVLTDAPRAATLPAVDGLRVTTFESLRSMAPSYGDGVEPSGTPHQASPEDTALLMLTSGSTGNSKAVRLSHANLLASMAGKNGYHHLSAADTTFNWVSFDHVAALLECHLLPLYAGSRQCHVEPPVILGEPLEFLRLLSRHRVTMTFAPNFLLGMLSSTDTEAESLDLSSLRHLISGGEAVVGTTGRAFLDRLARHGLGPDTLWPAFGMTETCAGSIYNPRFPAADRDQEFAAVGTPVEGLSIRVADERDRALPEGEVGELQLCGPVITTGYHNDARATAAAFTADGWFRSGDLGRITAGRLTLVGRSKDSVIVNGVNYFSHVIESALEELDGVARSYVAAFPTRPPHSDTEQLVVAFHPEVPDGDEAALHRVLTAVRSTVVMHWGFRPGLILPLDKADFPKTSLGKIQRALLRRRLESGEYETTVRAVAELSDRMLGGHTRPTGATEHILAGIYAEMFGIAPESVSATANFFELGGTSLDVLRLRSKVTRSLDVPGFQVIDLLAAPTVRALAARTTRGVSTAYDPIVPLQLSGTHRHRTGPRRRPAAVGSLPGDDRDHVPADVTARARAALPGDIALVGKNAVGRGHLS
ncbi:non-ribosomal peptide synthetase [Streptomyces sp. NPDC054864]